MKVRYSYRSKYRRYDLPSEKERCPVFINDSIYTIKTDLDKHPKYKDMGLYRASYEIFKNEGELVLYCEHIQTVKYRDPEQFQTRLPDGQV